MNPHFDEGPRHHILRRAKSAKQISFIDVAERRLKLVEIDYHRNPERAAVFYYR